ncbi:hypothetical protein NPIL_551911 [Nephila pilipes]|uniref:Uncharacterized protein n=1 Tax=Nephila pilipes TaxID=299642 RepID=A0A8X6TL46_NEPPI|nr:hypothetical protein NPIL_551911 [Nephila pilipes]
MEVLEKHEDTCGGKEKNTLLQSARFQVKCASHRCKRAWQCATLWDSRCYGFQDLNPRLLSRLPMVKAITGVVQKNASETELQSDDHSEFSFYLLLPSRRKDRGSPICSHPVPEIIPYLYVRPVVIPLPTLEIFPPSQHSEQSNEKFHCPSPLVTNEARFPPPVVGALQTRRGQLSDKSSIRRSRPPPPLLVLVTDEVPTLFRTRIFCDVLFGFLIRLDGEFFAVLIDWFG